MLLSGLDLQSAIPWHFGDFCVIFLPNIGKGQKKSYHLSTGPLALCHMVNPALVTLLKFLGPTDPKIVVKGLRYKIFGSNFFGNGKILDRQYVWVKEIFWVKVFGSKRKFGPTKNLGHGKNLDQQKIICQKKIASKKYIGSMQEFESAKN